jgi:hypothetical protein
VTPSFRAESTRDGWVEVTIRVPIHGWQQLVAGHGQDALALILEWAGSTVIGYAKAVGAVGAANTVQRLLDMTVEQVPVPVPDPAAN